jgi:CBS domain containing-hemolysin-like protein
MTLIILFLSESTPKNIGAVYWRSLAGFTGRFVRGLIFALYPLIWVSEAQDRGDVKP